jgi:hypothetical protein
LREDKRLTGCLFQVADDTEDETFVFHHDFLLHSALHFVTELRDKTFLIKNANVHILINKCWIVEGIAEQFKKAKQNLKRDPPVGLVCLSAETLKELANRISSEMDKGFSPQEWPNHVFWSHRVFRKLWDQIYENSRKKRSRELQIG